MVVPGRVSVHDGFPAEGVDFFGESGVILEEFGDGVGELVSGHQTRVVATEIIRQFVDDEPIALVQVAARQQVGLLEVLPDQRVVRMFFQKRPERVQEEQKIIRVKTKE